jgi:hypothetical protein
LVEIFGKFPAWYVKLKAWARLTPSEAKVLGVLVYLANNIEHSSSPDLDQLADLSGITRSSIPEVTKSLAISGLIDKRRVGNTIKYTVVFHPPEWLVETGVHWDLKADHVHRNVETFPKDPSTGRFVEQPKQEEPRP